MANRPRGYGMTAELARKKDAKYNPDLAQEAVDWVNAVIRSGGDASQAVDIDCSKQDNIHLAWKNGQTLCALINVLQPGSIKKVNTNNMAFKQMENIGKFLEEAEKYGVNKLDMFQTVDLFEGANIPQVINGIHAVGRKAQSKNFNGPVLGPKESAQNVREFTEEQLRAGEGVIGLQAGSNKGASQAGQSFGKPRHIID